MCWGARSCAACGSCAVARAACKAGGARCAGRGDHAPVRSGISPSRIRLSAPAASPPPRRFRTDAHRRSGDPPHQPHRQAIDRQGQGERRAVEEVGDRRVAQHRPLVRVNRASSASSGAISAGGSDRLAASSRRTAQGDGRRAASARCARAGPGYRPPPARQHRCGCAPARADRSDRLVAQRGVVDRGRLAGDDGRARQRLAHADQQRLDRESRTTAPACSTACRAARTRRRPPARSPPSGCHPARRCAARRAETVRGRQAFRRPSRRRPRRNRPPWRQAGRRFHVQDSGKAPSFGMRELVGFEADDAVEGRGNAGRAARIRADRDLGKAETDGDGASRCRSARNARRIAGRTGRAQCGLRPSPEKANSVMFVRPMMTAPAWRRRAIAGASATALGALRSRAEAGRRHASPACRTDPSRK